MRLKKFSYAIAAALLAAGVTAFAGLVAAKSGGGHGGGGHGGGGHFGGGHGGGGHFSGGHSGGGGHAAFRSFSRSHVSHGGSHRNQLRASGKRGKGYFAARSTSNRSTRLNTSSKINKNAVASRQSKGPTAAKTLNANKSIQKASLTKKNAFYNKSLHDRDHDRDRDRDRGDRYGRYFGYRWYGAAFWPYAFGDYFSYAFWPDDYYDSFWGYGPDAILGGAFWPYGEASYEGNIYNGSSDIYGSYRGRSRTTAPSSAAVAEICAGFAPGVSDLPIATLEKIVNATEEQQTALNDLKSAAAQASSILQQACPSQTPLTPVARLDAMQQRLQAMEQANDVVRAPLIRVYGLLTDEQKKRLEAQANSAGSRATRSKEANIGELCASQAGFANVPADSIENAITLTGAQQEKLQSLKDASAKAAEQLKTSCPSSLPATVGGRLDAAQQRVNALIQAVDTVRPAVKDFYASLTDEQKAALELQGGQRSASNRG